MTPKFSLRALLLGLIFAATSMMILPHLIWEYFSAIQVAEDTTTEQLMSVGHIISREVEVSLLNKESVLVDEQVRNVMLIRNMLSANVLNEQDMVLYSSTRSFIGEHYKDTEESHTREALATARRTLAASAHIHPEEAVICAIFPFEMRANGASTESQPIGAVILEMSIQPALDAARHYFINSAIFSVLIALITSILIWFAFRKSFLADLRRLLDSAIQYGSKGIVPEPLQLRSLELAAIDEVFLYMSKELEQRQRQLRSSEERFRRLFEASTDGLLMADGRKDLDSFRITEVNRSFIQLTDGDADKVVPGKAIAELLPAPFKPLIKQVIAEPHLGSQTLVRDVELLNPDGIRHYVRIWSFLDRYDATAPRLFLRVLDIDADRKRELLQAQVSKLHEASAFELERVGRLKDDFLANMSHELRTPLHGILGACDLLDDQVFGELSPKQREMVQISQKSARHLLSIINSILDLAKIEAGKFTMEFDARQPCELCEDAQSIVLPLAQQHGVQLTVESQESLECRVYVDSTRVRQVLLNLLSNAIQNTAAEGHVVLRCTCAEDKQTFLFEVVDTGCGIDESKLATLLNPFEQLSTGLNRSQNGTGLGLAMVEKLVKLHLGHLVISSKVGVGSTFAFVLPELTSALKIVENNYSREEDATVNDGNLDALILDTFSLRVNGLAAALREASCRFKICNSLAELPGLLMRSRPRILFIELEYIFRGVKNLVDADQAKLLSDTRIVGISNFLIQSESTNLSELYHSQVELYDVIAQPFSAEAIAQVMGSSNTTSASFQSISASG